MEGTFREAPADPVTFSQRSGRRILILDFDLFKNVGGGQSVYKSLIALNPGDTFFYFRQLEAEDAARPANCVAIPFLLSFIGAKWDLPRRTGHFFGTYMMCRNMAASVVRHCGAVPFDVVDTPDYNQLGLFIRQALEMEGCHVGVVALAMHGNLSTAFRHGWPTGQDDRHSLAELRVRERLQFIATDVRYAISETYAEQWQRHGRMAVNHVDPLIMLGNVAVTVPPQSDEPPDLVFVGRRERSKGPDLFLDLAWWIDRSAYRQLLMIGPEGYNRLGVGSEDILKGMIKQRELSCNVVGSMAQDDVHRLLEERTLLLLPSRQDTFNLVAIEALARGCPALVSSNAGVSRWLRRHVPELDWMIVDLDCSRAASTRTADVLRHYDARRMELAQVLTHHSLEPDSQTLDTMYTPVGPVHERGRQAVVDLAAHFAMLVQWRQPRPVRSYLHTTRKSVKRRVKEFIPPVLSAPVSVAAWTAKAVISRSVRQRLLNDAKIGVKENLRRHMGSSQKTFSQLRTVRNLSGIRHTMIYHGEASHKELEAKIKHLASHINIRLIDRVRLFRELSRLERKAGNDLIAVTYALRIMRWMGRDLFGDLPYVAATLQASGMPHEADAAMAMFGEGAEGFSLCLDHIDDAYRRNLTKPDLPLAILDDRRGDVTPRVSAIVSMYNAASKLPTLLTVLEQQTLASRRELEVILVDSGSPGQERQAFEAFASQSDLPILYARSEQRETIQAAWNRGIGLSRAPYLTFLGVDEGIHPDALRQLSRVLDNNPSVDWAMANSLVTDVDRDGVYSRDIMPYDRSGYYQDMTYLDTTYLSWVGGLYRRSIHDRFGMYDETFRAAGDTEFKMRVMPHIRSVHVPRMLGVFNNYPEERTTQSPRAELEDLRAWYLWRTPAGMQYAFARRPAEDAARLFRDCLRYRKAFCGHYSTDFDLAASLAAHLSRRNDAPAWAKDAQDEMRAVTDLMMQFELVPETIEEGPKGIHSGYWMYQQVKRFAETAERHQKLFGLPEKPYYDVFNDNRHEQHSWSWSGR